MEEFEKTRQEFSQDLGVIDLFQFKKSKLNFDIIREEYIYSNFFHALSAMITNFKHDNPCCLFCSDASKLNRLITKNSQLTIPDEEKENTVVFLTYSTKDGVILCKYYSDDIYLSHYVIKNENSGSYVTNTEKYQPVNLNDEALDLLYNDKENDAKWYIADNPGDVVCTNHNNTMKKLNGPLPLPFFKAVRFLKGYCNTVSISTFCDYILVPNKVCWDKNSTEEEISMIKRTFPGVNTYLDFTKRGTCNVHFLRSPLVFKHPATLLVFDFYLNNVCFDIYNKKEVKQYFDNIGIIMDKDEE